MCRSSWTAASATTHSKPGCSWHVILLVGWLDCLEGRPRKVYLARYRFDCSKCVPRRSLVVPSLQPYLRCCWHANTSCLLSFNRKQHCMHANLCVLFVAFCSAQRALYDCVCCHSTRHSSNPFACTSCDAGSIPAVSLKCDRQTLADRSQCCAYVNACLCIPADQV